MSDLAPLAEAVTVDPLVGHPADYHVFHKFIERCKSLPAISTAVVWPLSDVALRGTVEAALECLIEPTLIGDEAEMKALALKIGVDISRYPIRREGKSVQICSTPSARSWSSRRFAVGVETSAAAATWGSVARASSERQARTARSTSSSTAGSSSRHRAGGSGTSAARCVGVSGFSFVYQAGGSPA